MALELSTKDIDWGFEDYKGPLKIRGSFAGPNVLKHFPSLDQLKVLSKSAAWTTGLLVATMALAVALRTNTPNVPQGADFSSPMPDVPALSAQTTVADKIDDLLAQEGEFADVTHFQNVAHRELHVRQKVQHIGQENLHDLQVSFIRLQALETLVGDGAISPEEALFALKSPEKLICRGHVNLVMKHHDLRPAKFPLRTGWFPDNIQNPHGPGTAVAFVVIK